MDFAKLHGVDPSDYEELRLALVMNGGVSLAVWMGGVSLEINRLTSREGIYGQLLALTASRARVDVVSGTSAGGINGAFLALGQVYGTMLDPLRAVWLERGAFDSLLRDPYQPNPNSLLRGNEYFLQRLREAFAQIRGSGEVQPAAQYPIELALTTTLLHGELGRMPDDFGTLIADVNHRACFTFRRGPDCTHDDFQDGAGAGDPGGPIPSLADKLALAARATASFPVAFEPLFCPVGASDASKANIDGLVPMDGHTSFRRSRYLLDGGILDNKPFDYAINAVFRLRAQGDVRRVMCYIVPAPGATGDDSADDPGKLPSLGTVALASLVNIPRVQSIGAELETILQHNRSVSRQRNTRLAFARDVGWSGVETMAGQLFSLYRQRRLESAADYIVEEIAKGVTFGTGGDNALGRRRREWLTSILSTSAVPWVPASTKQIDSAAVGTDWTWGAFSLENIGEFMLDVLRRGLQLTDVRDPDRRRAMRELRTEAYDLMAIVPQVRSEDREFWRAQGKELQARLIGHEQAADIVQIATAWASTALVAWAARTVPFSGTDRIAHRGPAFIPMAQPDGRAPLQPVLTWLALTAAGLIADAAALLREVAIAAANSPRERSREAANDLRALIDFLVPETDSNVGQAPGGRPADVLQRLLTLDVVIFATAGTQVTDQFVELMQISADTVTAFGGPAKASQKLAGAQLANFAGFYRKAWRANDWMFGRLDGAERLLRILFNPMRLAKLYSGHVSAAQIAAIIENLAVPQPGDPDAGDAEYLKSQSSSARARLHGELAFLDRPHDPIPEQLNYAVAALLPRVHLSILRDELGAIAGACEDDEANGAGTMGPAADYLRAYRREVGSELAPSSQAIPARNCVTLFLSCHIGEERVDSQVGTDLFTKTATRTLAVAATALASKNSGLGPLRVFVHALRLPTLALDSLAQSVVRDSASGTAFFIAIFSASALVVYLELFTAAGPTLPSILATSATLLFVAAGALVLRRSWKLVAAWLLLALVIWVMHVGPKNAAHDIRQELSGASGGSLR